MSNSKKISLSEAELNRIRDFVRGAMFMSFEDNGDEFKYQFVYLEYSAYPEPMFMVVKEEPGKDPKIYGGKEYWVTEYMDKYQERWMKAMIKDITDQIQIKNNEAKMERKLDAIRKKVYEISKIID